MLEFPRWKIILISLVLVASVIFALPSLFSEAQVAKWPSWAPQARLNLGLDLQGGSHLLLEVDTQAVVRQRVESLEDTIRGEVREAKDAKGDRIGVGNFRLGPDYIEFMVRDPAHVDQVVELMRNLSQPLGSLSGQRDLAVSVADGSRVQVKLTPAGITDKKRQAVQQSIEIVRRRIDAMGTKEPSITRQGDERIVVQVPGLQNPQQLKELLSKTAVLEFKMVDTEAVPENIARGRVPPGSEVLPMADDPSQKIAVKRRLLLTGEQLSNATPGFDQRTGEPVVNFVFDTVGGRKFGKITTENTGKPFAIILDDKVISAPRINEPILGGTGQISGSFTVESSTALAAMLRAGALPAPLNILEERTVGPDLGKDSVEAGTRASIVGLALVVLLMMATYGRFGLYANIALVFNVAMILAVLAIAGATLTLPGIAGLVLTIGAAVDANVLVFERIREELRNGRTPLNAVDTGYREASRTIMDANVTNLIAAALMFQFGTGPIKGFAVVLTIGIVTSVFTAVTVCRMFTAVWLRRARPARLTI